MLVHAIRRRRRRHRPNPRPIVGRGVHRAGQKQAQTIGIQRKKHRPRDAVKKRANAITNHSTSVPVHFACTHQPQRRRRHRPGFLRRAMPPAVVRAPAVSPHGDARAQRPHTQQVNRTTEHPTQSTYPSVSHASTVQPHRCPHHHPRPLQSGAPSTQTRPPQPGAGRTPPDGVQRVAARNPPPSSSPRPQSPTYCWTGSSPVGQKQAQTIRIQRQKHRPRDAVKKRAIATANDCTSVPVDWGGTEEPTPRHGQGCVDFICSYLGHVVFGLCVPCSVWCLAVCWEAYYIGTCQWGRSTRKQDGVDHVPCSAFRCRSSSF